MLHNSRCVSKIMPPSKHTAAHVLPGQKMPTASFAKAKDAKGNLKPTIHTKPYICMKMTN